MSECNEWNSDEKSYYKKKQSMILNWTTDYYENDNERLREQAKYKYEKDTIICLKKRSKN